MFRFIKKFFLRTDAYNQPKRDVDMLIDLVSKLNPRAFREIQSSDKSILQVFVPYTTIHEYNAEVQQCFLCIKSGNLLRLDRFAERVRSLPLPLFFLNDHGHYIDEEKALAVFNQSVLDLAYCYHRLLDFSENNTTTDAHNLRHASLMINNLYHLYRELSYIP